MRIFFEVKIYIFTSLLFTGLLGKGFEVQIKRISLGAFVVREPVQVQIQKLS